MKMSYHVHCANFQIKPESDRLNKIKQEQNKNVCFRYDLFSFSNHGIFLKTFIIIIHYNYDYPHDCSFYFNDACFFNSFFFNLNSLRFSF